LQPNNAILGCYSVLKSSKFARSGISTTATTPATTACKGTHKQKSHCGNITILEFPAISSSSSSSSSAHEISDEKGATKQNNIRSSKQKNDASEMKYLRCYTFSNKLDSWSVVKTPLDEDNNNNNNHKRPIDSNNEIQRLLSTLLYERFLCHFLPRGYPQTVDVGYLSYTYYTFLANVAGSASMVLSTQTLLLAVGIVGHHQGDESIMQAGVMAGALNWVLKDGVGQLGGIAFASYVAKRTHNLDSNPKQWRLLAAVTLDVAAFMELSAPFLSSSYSVLALACVANIFKNIGFLTASASRAALHQALADHDNLADVTAKSGSQAMAAGLVGTGLGIILSQWIVHDANPTHFMAAFGVLALFHQGFNYLALRNVVLRQFDSRRLALVIDAFLTSGKVPTPEQIAQQERFWWWHDQSYNSNNNKGEIRIGRTPSEISPSIPQLLQITMNNNHQRRFYYVEVDTTFTHDKHTANRIHRPIVHLVYLDGASGHDIIQGFFHASVLLQRGDAMATSQSPQLGQDDADLDYSTLEEATATTMSELFPSFLSQLQVAGWRTNTESTRHVEPSDAVRWSIEFPPTHP
jgi:hypothetical protein